MFGFGLKFNLFPPKHLYPKHFKHDIDTETYIKHTHTEKMTSETLHACTTLLLVEVVYELVVIIY